MCVLYVCEFSIDLSVDMSVLTCMTKQVCANKLSDATARSGN